MIDTTNIDSIYGSSVYGSDGDKIGSVEQVYLADDSGAPVWATVRTGLFGTSESFVPLEGASLDGDRLSVAYDKSFVKDAPRIDADGALTEHEEAELYRYYNLSDTADRAAGYSDSTTGVDTSVGHDTSGPTTDDAMTRSEEQLHVGTQRVEAGRARLRKHIVTEQQTVTVPVSHDEVRVVREPITDTNVGSATSGPELSEEEHEVVLGEERVVTAKETVPVERVALGTETITEQQQVTEDVRHEEIDVEDDGVTPRRDRDRL
ncbi:DUF2382 domain-containing protein [Rathayibacter iranicus]|uniref:DUF2382 domain-containing protein n=2 Tax=Rathayibacter iranicus TaxID=59737 RepID=A0AAD1EMB0_9MICO|nr:PRC and DUF2382 domain-containing protein [Rathayibacter iranicus]AZZ55515.1 DUF2382 domain-containing protein [Rathayibacter iranicus]MWV31653.1 DUF2382 domain-containing protein [Rathayibacter iranicus NCPPB 2253 = VKM Ac-1602]PPI48304.1 photosystem reaction center subunit H [Rathayibacter iranicus]PPI60935.1 photosystem reaction center subunit H [Rathayibacter iranicus]PPI72536.1 photosystem reaction center subunit H [Rathayibacter iranicus]